MVLMVAKDKRPVFAIPRGDVVYIGTTDTRYKDPPNVWPAVFASEIEYLLAPIKDYFNVELNLGDCISTWAGLRPLILQRGKSTKEISRKDEIWVSRSGLITIAGGKLTGYRKMAENTVDESVRLLGLSARSSSEDVPLPGGDFSGDAEQLVSQLATEFHFEEGQAWRLIRLYGSEAKEVVKLNPEPVSPDSHILKGELLWAIEKEGATSLEDVIYRRTRAAYYRPHEVSRIVEDISKVVATDLDWSEQHRLGEVETVNKRFGLDTNIG
jgi:glycerol-3-phosphate dehydrogenase